MGDYRRCTPPPAILFAAGCGIGIRWSGWSPQGSVRRWLGLSSWRLHPRWSPGRHSRPAPARGRRIRSAHLGAECFGSHAVWDPECPASHKYGGATGGSRSKGRFQRWRPPGDLSRALRTGAGQRSSLRSQSWSGRRKGHGSGLVPHLRGASCAPKRRKGSFRCRMRGPALAFGRVGDGNP